MVEGVGRESRGVGIFIRWRGVFFWRSRRLGLGLKCVRGYVRLEGCWSVVEEV